MSCGVTPRALRGAHCALDGEQQTFDGEKSDSFWLEVAKTATRLWLLLVILDLTVGHTWLGVNGARA